MDRAGSAADGAAIMVSDQAARAAVAVQRRACPLVEAPSCQPSAPHELTPLLSPSVTLEEQRLEHIEVPPQAPARPSCLWWWHLSQGHVMFA